MGQVLRREYTNISKVALRWTPKGKRKRGRPKYTWRRTAEAKLPLMQASRLPLNRQEWGILLMPYAPLRV